jgi:(S)-2-hydroxyglutarate dehydrogenase
MPCRTNQPPRCDIAVVGAGIVGLSVARELMHRMPRARIVVLEAEDAIAAHQTSHNSGVIHAGIYYTPGSLKAHLCVDGARRLYEYCEQNSLAAARLGKVIVATDTAELDRLDELERRGRANGVGGLRRVSGTQLSQMEPSVSGLGALYSPNTGICDFAQVARAIADELKTGGVEIITGAKVTGGSHTHAGIELLLPSGALPARYAVFCAGAWSDRLAEACGAPSDPRIVPFRGAYMRLREERTQLVSLLVYPVPRPDLPFLGVHFTPTLSGEVLVGPTALLVAARDAYRLTDIRATDLRSTLSWPGTWRLLRRFFTAGATEIVHAASTRALASDAARYVDSLSSDDLVPAFAGVRAQALGRDGTLADDFLLSHTERTLHVRNAPSPAATSALSLATTICDRVARLTDAG